MTVPGIPVIIDTDPGVDDLLALALAARSPELELVAVTTSYGNAPLPATTRNARAVLRLAGRERTPVRPGSATPVRRTATTAPVRHGPDGSGDAPVPAATAVTPNPTVLAELLESSSPVTLLTLGPLTNLAWALRKASDAVPGRITRHLGMFGRLKHGVDLASRADFNTWCDPEAADLVLRSPLSTTMIPVDATRHLVLPAGVVGRALQSPDPLVAWLGRALECALRYDRSERGLDGVLVHDVLVVGALIDPDVIRREQLRLEVSLDAGEARGHTRERENGIPTSVALGVDVERMMALLGRVLPI